MDLNFDFDEQIETLAKVPKPIRLAVVSAVLVAVAAGFWFVSYEPRRDEVSQLHEHSRQLQRQLGLSTART